MSGRFWLISVLAFVAVSLVGVKVILPRLVDKKIDDDFYKMTVGEVQIEVMVADDSDEMERGLGNRTSMEANQGMVFVYPRAVIPRFWMKGMQFDLDFVWIREGVVVDILEGVMVQSGDGELNFYSPKESVTHVLEVNAGFINENGIEIGDVVDF